MRTIVLLVVILAIVAMLIVDGLGMFAAHRIAVEVAKGSAEQAAQVYAATDSERAAEHRVQGIASEAEAQLVSASYHAGTTRWYQVTVRVEPATHFLKHVPYLSDLLVQESTAVVHF
ncbi:MAG TPA: hypothetical protein VJP78_15670 [Thermoleophilia bacterium]|nr:hypothetical protein [Thermoleophilia bacterium]